MRRPSASVTSPPASRMMRSPPPGPIHFWHAAPEHIGLAQRDAHHAIRSTAAECNAIGRAALELAAAGLAERPGTTIRRACRASLREFAEVGRGSTDVANAPAPAARTTSAPCGICDHADDTSFPRSARAIEIVNSGRPATKELGHHRIDDPDALAAETAQA